MTQRFLLVICLSASLHVWSQAGTGSPYSFGGLGEINYRGNHWSRALGGLEFYTDSIHVDFNNPSGLAKLKLTNFSLGLDYKNNKIEDANNTQKIGTSSLNYLGLSIPTKHFGFNFGLIPYSSVGYRLELFQEGDEVDQAQRFEGNGGLNLAFVSAGFNLFKWWSVGATARYGFGNINHQSSQQTQNIDRTTFLESNSSLSGISYKFSTLLVFPLGKQNLHFYTAYAPEATINSRNNEIFTSLSTSSPGIGQQLEVDLESSGLDETVLILPTATTLGLGIGTSKKWFLGGQFVSISNSDFRNDFITLDGLRYEDGNRLSLGGFFIPNYSSLTSYWKRIVYRVGYYNEKTGIRVQQSSLKNRGISFGVGLPSFRLGPFSNANLGVTLGSRSTSNPNLVDENYWHVKLGFSLNDVWFIKRKYN